MAGRSPLERCPLSAGVARCRFLQGTRRKVLPACQGWRAVTGVQRRVLPQYPDYDISNLGEIRRIAPVRSLRKVPYALKNTSDGPYFRVGLVLPTGKVQHALVHRLVCEAFHGPAPTDRPNVAHWDGDGTNNAAGNLRWASQSENLKDRDPHGTDPRGERGPNAKLTLDQVHSIRLRFTGKVGEQTTFARELGVTVATINHIVRGKTWRNL